MTPATTKNVPGSLPWYDEDEYAVCLRDSRTLPVILSGRRSCVPLPTLGTSDLASLQAAGDPRDATSIWSLSHWTDRHSAP
jgi:hypothetical protein